MSVDWKILPKGDSGIYLHGSPQVQIWEKPQIGQWNTSFIRMVDDKVTVKLNGQLIVDNVTMEKLLGTRQAHLSHRRHRIAEPRQRAALQKHLRPRTATLTDRNQSPDKE